MRSESWSRWLVRGATAMLLVVASLSAAPPAGAAPKKATAITGWSTKAAVVAAGGTWSSGSLHVGGPAGRPVLLQRKSGKSWVTLVKRTSSASHRVAFSRTLTAPASYVFRVLVPAARRWKAAATPGRVVVVPPNKVTTIAGWPTSPAQFGVGATWNIGVTVSGPVGRAARMQEFVGGVWTTVATAVTTASHVASFSHKLTTAGSSSFRVAVPAVPFWSAAQSASVGVTISPVGGGVTAPTSISGTINGNVCIGRCVGAEPPIQLGWTGMASYTRTGKDGAGNDVYALASATVSWHVQSGADSLNCALDGGGVLGGVDALSIFQGNGRLRPVVPGATSGDWVADFQLSGRGTAPGAAHTAMPWGFSGAGCPNQLVEDHSTVFFGSRSYGVLSTNGVQSPTYTGPVMAGSPNAFGGTTTDGVLPPDNVTWTYSFGA